MSKLDDVVDAVSQIAEDCKNLSSRVDAVISKRRDAIDPEKVRALYERAGTPGEKAAARAALLRMGVDPDKEKETAKSRAKGNDDGNPYPKYTSEWVKWKHDPKNKKN